MKTAITKLIALLIGLGTLAGCNDPRAEAPSRTRIDRINGYAKMMRDREAQGHRRVAHTLDLIERQNRRSDEHLRRDLRRLNRRSHYDIQRWHDRQPRYRSDLLDMWDGNPDLANEMIPRMFY